MSLKEWADKKLLRPHKTSHDEISDLFGIVKRDLETAQTKMVADWQFGIAYNAVLKLCTILLYASGYRPGSGQSIHFTTIQALPLILGEKFITNKDYLDHCRVKRHEVEYDAVGGATDADIKELIVFTREFQKTVVSWLKRGVLLKSQECPAHGLLEIQFEN